MSKILLSDIHWGVRNSSQFYLNETIKYFDKLFSFISGINNEINEIYVLGDFLDDRREINILVLNEIQKFLNNIEDLKIPTYYILGNHDIFYKNNNSVNGIEPLLKNYFYQKVISEPTQYGNDVLIPWINNDNKEKIKLFLQNLKNKEKITVYGHFSFNELIFNQIEENNDNFETLSFFKDFKKVYSGHYHINTSRGNITYLGSIIDFQWAEETSDHGFYFIDNEIESFIKNDYLNHKKYFINCKEDLINILNDCNNKEIKIIISKNFKMSHKEYDYYISEINKICYNLQVLLANEIFLEEENFIKTKTFEEFIIEFFKNKNYGADIDNNKLIKIFLQLYNITKTEDT